MAEHEWKAGDEALHVMDGVIVEVVKVIGPRCLLVMAGKRRFVVAPKWLRLIEDLTE